MKNLHKIQDSVDLAEFLNLPREKLDQIVKGTPMHIIEIIATAMKALCVKIGATEEETDQCIQKVRDRKMGYLFENMEKMNIQEERKKTAETLLGSCSSKPYNLDLAIICCFLLQIILLYRYSAVYYLFCLCNLQLSMI